MPFRGRSQADVEAELRLARAYAANRVPFFAEALFAAKLILCDQIPSLAAIDRHMRVYFNPTLVRECWSSTPQHEATRQMAWLWVHEISHAIRAHGIRAETARRYAMSSYGPSLWETAWNVACDAEINDNEFDGLEPPEEFPPINPRSLCLENDHLAEFYFEKLLSSNRYCYLGVYSKAEGSGVDGVHRPWEVATGNADVPIVSQTDQSVFRTQIALDIRENRHKGLVPAGWLRWADTLLPQVDWRKAILRRFQQAMLESPEKHEFSYRLPNRRSLAYVPFIRPGRMVNRQHNLAIVVDTSGSMNQDALTRCLAEIRGILEVAKTTITVIPCDSVAYEPIKITRDSDIIRAAKTLCGGGGTDMVVGIEAALALKPRPTAIIVLTDGFTRYPNKPIESMSVIFGILQANNGISDDPPLPKMPPWQERDIIRIPLSS